MRKLLIFLAALLIMLLGAWGTVVLMFDEARLKQLAIDQVEQRTGRTLRLDGPLELSLFPTIELIARDVTLEAPPGLDGPALFDADEFRMAVALIPLLRGEVETGALALDGAELRIHTDPDGRTTLDGLATEAAPDTASEVSTAERPEVTIEAIRLTDVRLVVSDARDGSLQRVLLERFELEAFRFGADVPFSLRGQAGDPPILSDLVLTGTVNVPSGSGPIRFSGLRLSASSGGQALRLDGNIVLNTDSPASARLENGALRFGDQELDLSAEWRGTPRPSIRAEVAADALDVDALLAALPSGPAAPANDDAESPLLRLRDLDLDAALSIGRMQIGGLPLSDVVATLTARGGIATLDPLQAKLQGGRVEALARIDLNQTPPRLDLRPRFDLESLSGALAPWGMDRFLSGKGSLELQLTGRGLTPDTLLGTLSGGGGYAFSEGEIRGLDLDGMTRALAERDVAAAVARGVGGTTRFRQFEGPLAIDDGVVDLSGLTLLTEQLGVSGTVRLGLADLALDGELRLASEQLGQVPLALGGQLTAPSLSPDVGGLLRDEAERRVLDWLRRQGEDDGDDGGTSDGGSQ